MTRSAANVNDSPEQLRAQVETQVIALFSGAPTTIGEMRTLAHALEHTKGIDAFFTPLPWKMQLPDGTETIGSSQHLLDAARNVQGHLALLGETYPDDAPVALSIEQTRFRDLSSQRKNTREGGLNA